MKVSVRVYGRPVPKKRPRVYRGRAITPIETVEWENQVAQAWREQTGELVIDGMVRIWCYFGLKRHSVTDLDNLEKSVWDGLEKGGAFVKGDQQIYESFASKFPPVNEESVIIVVKTIDEFTYPIEN